jgi:dTDP-glucose 4,6-dehydratase
VQRGRRGEKYNIGGRSEQTTVSVAEVICAVLDRRHPAASPHRRFVTFVPDRPGHDFRYAIDARKMESETGWRAVESFASGIEKTVDWYLDNAAWWNPLRSTYRGERLGLLPERQAASHEATL